MCENEYFFVGFGYVAFSNLRKNNRFSTTGGKLVQKVVAVFVFIKLFKDSVNRFFLIIVQLFLALLYVLNHKSMVHFKNSLSAKIRPFFSFPYVFWIS